MAILAHAGPFAVEGGGMMRFGKIGARRMMWKNPYITDGLVAWWDGIWNAGLGVHDSNATVWRDIIGGREFVLPQGQYQITGNAINMVRSSSVTRLDCWTDIQIGDVMLEAYGPQSSSSGIVS